MKVHLTAAFATTAAAAGLLLGCGTTANGSADNNQAGAEEAFAVARPATVPSEFVLTPYGYFHPSCVVEVRPGETVGQGRILQANGLSRPIAGCQHPSFDNQGRAISRDAPVRPSSIDGFPDYADQDGPIDTLLAHWDVPESPSVSGLQVLRFFTELKPSVPSQLGAHFLAPILTWQNGSWTGAAWDCCRGGTVFHSTPMTVQPGHTIQGQIAGRNCSRPGDCSLWHVVFEDIKNSDTPLTDLFVAGVGEVFDHAVGGAFQAVNVDSCRQYPPGGIGFSAFFLSLLGQPVAQNWSPHKGTVSPDCGGGTIATPDFLQFLWNAN
jgi:hypothetical protein